MLNNIPNAEVKCQSTIEMMRKQHPRYLEDVQILALSKEIIGKVFN